MAVNFPDSPTNGDTTVINGATYTWDGVKWDVSAIATSSGPADSLINVYNSASELPTSSSNGDIAWVGGTTNKLYVSNGSAWFAGTFLNDNPVIVSVEDASANTTPFTLATDGTPTVITVTATDPENMNLTYTYAVTTGTLGTTATVTQGTGAQANEFTITPGTTDPDDAGTFELTFTVSDGVNDVTSVASFDLSFVSNTWSLSNSDPYIAWQDLVDSSKTRFAIPATSDTGIWRYSQTWPSPYSTFTTSNFVTVPGGVVWNSQTYTGYHQTSAWTTGNGDYEVWNTNISSPNFTNEANAYANNAGNFP